MTRACWIFLITGLCSIGFTIAVGSDNHHLSSEVVELPIPLGGMPALHVIDQLVKKPFRLGTLTYASDTPFERAEFLYLVGYKTGDRITAPGLKKAIRYLAKKNKFSSVRLRIMPGGGDSKNLHLELESFWTVRRVILSGISNGRDVYRHLYDIDPGEAFDEKKHKHSLENIKAELMNQGYLSAEVSDSFVADYGSKSFLVDLALHPGQRFRLGSVHVTCNADHETKVSHGECGALHDKIDRFFAKRIEKKMYSAHLLNKTGKNIKQFLAKKGFLQASVSLKEHIRKHDHTVDLVIAINLQSKKEFVFFGNHFFSDQQLQDLVLSFGSSTLLVPTSLFAQEIENFYHKRGLLKVSVEAREEEATCFFVIVEGPRELIKKMELHGVKHGDVGRVRSCYRAHFKKNSFFDEEKMKLVIDDIENLYHQGGFALAKVTYEAVPNDASDHCMVHIQVDEGSRYYLNAVSIPAFPEFERQGPFLLFSQSVQPIPFDSAQLQVQRRWLADNLHQRGYLYVDIKPIVTVKQAPCCLVNVEWQIVLNQDKVVFGKTVIAGSCPLPFERFMRELHYKEGQSWNKTALEKSLLRLRDLSLFSNIYLYPENIALPESEKVVMAKLVEDDPFEIRVRGGVLGVAKNLTWREGTTYKIGGSLLCKNIFDTGGQLRFDADLTKFERYISACYVYPWLFDMPYTTVSKIYSNRYIQPVMQGSKDQLYVAVQQGFLLGLKRKYTNVTTGLNAGLEWVETTVKNRAAAQAIDFSPALVGVKVPYLYLEPTIVADYLDDKLNPTLGSFTFASVKGMVPLRKVEDAFIKLSVEQSFFYPAYKSLVAGLRCRVGHIFNQCFKQIMPPERFYLGGANSVRGYDPDFVPPLGCFEDQSGRKKYVPQGGKSMLNANFELRFPLMQNVNGAVFQDAGVLLGDDVSCIREQFVTATGAGIRYNTPVGPLRFDVGFKWKKRYPNDSRMAWYLTLGNIF